MAKLVNVTREGNKLFYKATDKYMRKIAENALLYANASA